MTGGRSHGSRAAAEDGFTLVELLVTMSLALVVLFAVLNITDAFTSGSAANSRLTDAQDRLRSNMGTVVRNLRDAPPVNAAAAAGSITPIAAARAGDVIFRSPNEAEGYLRYCVGPNATSGLANDALRVGRKSGAYVDPGASCPAGASGGWTYGDLIPRGLRGGAATISYSCGSVACTTPAAVRSVIFTIAAEHGPGKTLRLTSAVAPRNRG